MPELIAKSIKLVVIPPNIKKIKDETVIPVLGYLGYPVLERIILGTGAQESGFRATGQHGGGPALGWWQMEPDTELDITNSFLVYHKDLYKKVTEIHNSVPDPGKTTHYSALIWNPKYACAMAACSYVRHAVDRVDAIGRNVPTMAKFYKKYYNTPSGKATEAEFIVNYGKMIEPIYV